MSAPNQLHVKVTLNLPFETFGPAEREEFLRDLERVTGSPREAMEDIRFRKGCIIFEGDLDKAAVARLVEILNKGNPADLPEDIRAFLEKYSVQSVDSGVTARLQIIEKKPATAELIFVHGWRGDPQSFGDLPKYLSTLLGVPYRHYQYPTKLWKPGSSPSIEFIAANLDNWMRNHIRASSLGLVAHSMGGLVLRRLIVSQYWRERPLDSYMKQLTFVASPHNGAVLASLVGKIPAFEGVQLSELSPDSPFLFDLNGRWQYWCKTHVPVHCRVRCLLGTRDDIVSINNARGLDPDAVPILNADHSSILQPQSPEDETVVTIARFMRESSLLTSQVNGGSQRSGKERAG